MDENDQPTYKHIRVTGTVSLERIHENLPRRRYAKVLIMGPTGAGKSTFIEALGKAQNLEISSPGLDGFTKHISAYKLTHISRSGFPIYLIDSPGFADTKISEGAIVGMLKKWRRDNGRFSRILYLTPITNARMPGSQRQVMDTFKALTGSESAEYINIVTTMWDTLNSERATKRAEATFTQLQDDVWKDFISSGAHILKFHNTQQSAISVLDDSFGPGVITTDFNIEKRNLDIRNSPFSVNIYNDLQVRVQARRLEKRNIEEELGRLGRARSQVCDGGGEGDDGNNGDGDGDDDQLKKFFEEQLEDVTKYLAQFEKELEQFGSPPEGWSPSMIPEPQLFEFADPSSSPQNAITSTSSGVSEAAVSPNAAGSSSTSTPEEVTGTVRPQAIQAIPSSSTTTTTTTPSSSSTTPPQQIPPTHSNSTSPILNSGSPGPSSVIEANLNTVDNPRPAPPVDQEPPTGITTGIITGITTGITTAGTTGITTASTTAGTSTGTLTRAFSSLGCCGKDTLNQFDH